MLTVVPGLTAVGSPSAVMPVKLYVIEYVSLCAFLYTYPQY